MKKPRPRYSISVLDNRGGKGRNGPWKMYPVSRIPNALSSAGGITFSTLKATTPTSIFTNQSASTYRRKMSDPLTRGNTCNMCQCLDRFHKPQGTHEKCPCGCIHGQVVRFVKPDHQHREAHHDGEPDVDPEWKRQHPAAEKPPKRNVDQHTRTMQR